MEKSEDQVNEIIRKKFHDFQNSPYRGEWNQVMTIKFTTAQLRDFLRQHGGIYGNILDSIVE